MKYTLYVDESGDFESARGQWVLSGVLIADTYQACEELLNKHFNAFPSRLGLKSINDFHLTELRKIKGHSEAVHAAKLTIDNLARLGVTYKALAAINFSKKTLDEREKNYRLMLADIVALCETAIPDDEVISKLDIVIASRTINGVKQTLISDIYSDALNALPLALEMDLATKGLVDLMGKCIKVHMDYANNSWGLVCADFIANLNYHYNKNDESALLEDFSRRNIFIRFESFGGFDIRRANVAERNNDYMLALYRWLNIALSSIENSSEEPIKRLIDKIFAKLGTTGSAIALEALIDKLWRSNNIFEKYANLLKMLTILESAIELYFSISTHNRYYYILFRLRNLKLILLNHLGDTTEAFNLIDQQKKLIRDIASNPQHFNLILNFNVAETETFVNSLDLKQALFLSNSHSSLLNSYRDIWELIAEDNYSVIEFNKSSNYIKSEMSLFRLSILNIGLEGETSTNEIETRFFSLDDYIDNATDRARFENYKMMFFIRTRQPEKAISLINSISGIPTKKSPFDVFWYLRAVNDAFLLNKLLDYEFLYKRSQELLFDIDLSTKGHPYDLILRELALLEFNNGNLSKAKKYINRSKKTFTLEKSEISTFLIELIELHDDYINNKISLTEGYFKSLRNCTLIDSINTSELKNGFLYEVRHYSPY